jgi:hypothetical protein
VEKNRTIGFEMAQYFALTATAMADPAFARFVAHRIQTACFDRATLLILRLPVIPNGENPLLAGIAAILPALRQTGVIIPRTIVPNILFATEDLEEDQHMSALPPLHMMVHESFDFWRYTQSFYTEAASISVLVSNPGTGGDEHSMDVRPIYGPNARLHWLPPESGVGSLRLFA